MTSEGWGLPHACKHVVGFYAGKHQVMWNEPGAMLECPNGLMEILILLDWK